MSYNSTIDTLEIEKFSQLCTHWWDPSGPLRPLHEMNPLRLAYIREQASTHFPVPADALSPLSGLTVLDIGCGGGLLSEPLCRLGAQVTGIDMSAQTIQIAQHHAQEMGLSIHYEQTSAEDLAAQGVKFDMITALEVIEHVAQPNFFIQTCAQLLKPGGVLFVSTLNRTLSSFLMGIVGAEYVLRLLPPGTHQWQRFMKPSEVAEYAQDVGLRVQDIRGMSYNILWKSWAFQPRPTVNYIMSFCAPSECAA